MARFDVATTSVLPAAGTIEVSEPEAELEARDWLTDEWLESVFG
ncbi:MAG: hypothetical protein ACR2NM_06875 [Bythopirellula sp.]